MANAVIAPRCVRTVALVLATAWCTPLFADDEGLTNDAKNAGHTIGHAAREVGHGVKKAAKTVGKETKTAGKAVGHAAKEGAKEVKRAVKGES